MPSERVQRTVNQLLDESEQAAGAGEWARVQALCERVLTLDPENTDARSFLGGAERGLSREEEGLAQPGVAARFIAPAAEPAAAPQETAAGSAGVSPARAFPASFASGRYEVKRF